MSIALIVVAILVAVTYLWFGGAKLAGATQATEALDHVGVGLRLRHAIGVLEVLGAVGILVGLAYAWIGLAAALGLAALMVGALQYHRRAGDRGGALGLPASLLMITLIAAALYLASV